ncbi:hypothetical protein CYY_000506 [Polysphondylium violaceum]|uniref:Major facilitator superfamily (MFS) profile domain-containing protein n=1 Tax=Polysphondylium violaceum TaxID=133409 RepID=A0A8J4Q1Q9_9MYCE|nr:hypothetical protein CYY_000506 [Polysphondylium violaceum]
MTTATTISIAEVPIYHRLEQWVIEIFNQNSATKSSTKFPSPIVPKIFYFFVFYCFGGSRPFIPLFLEKIGMEKSTIGMVLLFPPLIMFLAAPVWAGISDKYNAHRRVFIITGAGTGFMLFLLCFFDNHALVIIIIFLNAVFWSAIIPLADSTTYRILGPQNKDLYGKSRSVGSVSFAISAFLIGSLIDSMGITVVWVNYAISAALLCISLYFLHNNEPISNFETLNDQDELTDDGADSQESKEEQQQEQEEQEKESIIKKSGGGNAILRGSQSIGKGEDSQESSPMIISPGLESTEVDIVEGIEMDQMLDEIEQQVNKSPSPTVGEPKQSFFKSAKILLSNTRIIMVLFNSFVISSGMSVVNNYIAITIKTDFHGPSSLIGIAVICNVTFEIVFFFFGKYLLNRFGVFKMIIISHTAIIVRVLAYSILLRLQWSPWCILPVELMHGICFATIWNSGSKVINDNSPPGLQATGQSIFFGLYMGVGTGLGALCGGLIYNSFGAIVMYECVALSVFTGFLIFISAEYFLLKQKQRIENKIITSDPIVETDISIN